MPMHQTHVIDRAREFAAHEMFFSTTDPRGVIRAGNDVFTRVSGYSSNELVGRAHNIIRHPDMPRAVFRLIWRYLKASNPVCGVVKNRAKDGSHYWVIALITPSSDGYLSVRFKPTDGLVATLQPVYAEMLQAEAAGGENGGMDASELILRNRLVGLGFKDYDAFSRSMLFSEIGARDALLAQQRRALFPETISATTGEDAALGDVARSVFTSARQAYQQVNGLYSTLAEFIRLNDSLEAKLRSVLSLTRDFRVISFNAAFASDRRGETARGLRVISEHLGTLASSVGSTADRMGATAGAASDHLGAVVFGLMASRLQIEMLLVFCAEVSASLARGEGRCIGDRCAMIGSLQDAFRVRMQAAVVAIGSVARELSEMDGGSNELRRQMFALQVAHTSGTIATGMMSGDTSQFSGLFAQIRQQIDATRSSLDQIEEVVAGVSALAATSPRAESEIRILVREMERAVGRLHAA